MIKAEDRAYCAGLFEGEGSIHARYYARKAALHKYKTRHISLVIVMTDREPLDLFQDITGFGKVRGPYDNGPGRKKFYDYSVTSFAEVQFIICNMWMWITPRRKEQIGKAFTMFKNFEPGRII